MLEYRIRSIACFDDLSVPEYARLKTERSLTDAEDGSTHELIIEVPKDKGRRFESYMSSRWAVNSVDRN